MNVKFRRAVSSKRERESFVNIAKLSQSQPANPQLGAEIALLSQLWRTTIQFVHHTPDTQNSRFEVLQSFS